MEEVGTETGLTERASREVVGAITSVITNALARGEKVTLVGFGTFQIRERKARTGVNPQTGETIQIPAQKAPCMLSLYCCPQLCNRPLPMGWLATNRSNLLRILRCDLVPDSNRGGCIPPVSGGHNACRGFSWTILERGYQC